MKTRLLISLAFFPVLLSANPIPDVVKMSEIVFNWDGQWLIELDPDYGVIEYVDSVIIETNSGMAKLVYWDPGPVIVISNQNLSTPLTINIYSDCVKLHSWTWGIRETDSIQIGDYPGSYLHNLNEFQSVEKYYPDWPFYKDNEPNPWYENDFNGSKGKIYGHFYDYNHEPITNKYFFIDEGYSSSIAMEQGLPGFIQIDGEGYYCAEISTRFYSISERLIYQSPPEHELMLFELNEFEIEENDSINIDFIGLYNSVDEMETKNMLLTNYPNPAADYTYFILDRSRQQNTSCRISIYDMNGRQVDEFFTSSDQYRYDCSSLSEGIYSYSISLDHQMSGSGKLIVAR